MPRVLKTDPVIIELPARLMATVTSVGDPNVVGGSVMPALYGAVYPLKFALKKQGIEFKVETLRARWPDAHLLPKDQWTAHWAIPVPEGTMELLQKVPGVTVALQTWQYGTVAQILHLGPYTEEGPTVIRLHQFITDSGYEIAGPHEEEYVTRPDAKA
ncbi:MAG: GyrI-like domain-containing protein, partial [bacterium]